MDYDMPLHEARQLPLFTLREIDLPEVQTWQVNKDYFLIVKVEMVGQRNMKDVDAPNSDRHKIEGDFRIKSVKALGRDPIDLKTVEQKDWENTVAKALSGEV